MPQIYSYLHLPNRSAFLANPKSAIFTHPFFSNTFSGFMSRWIQEHYAKFLNPLMIPPKIGIQSSYLSLDLGAWLIIFRRSESHNYMIRYAYLFPMQLSMSSTILGPLTYFIKDIYDSRAANKFYYLIFVISICLMATSCPVFKFLDLKTFP